jgi:aerobic-type carbon monoxide dehydrogenase small subunit (CoxS/CutS family)
METRSIKLVVNGRERTVEVAVSHTLLDVLRDDLELTGTKECCLVGECGACTVMVDGRIVDSCLMLAVEADGAEILTVEGLAQDGQLSPLQQAFLDKGAVQCGFCTPGQLMAAQALLDGNCRSERRGDPGGHGRQPLPVRLLLPDHRGGPLRRRRGSTDDHASGRHFPQPRRGLRARLGPPGVRGRHPDPGRPRGEARHPRLRQGQDHLDRHVRGGAGPGCSPRHDRGRPAPAHAPLRAAARGPADDRRRRDEVPRRSRRHRRGRKRRTQPRKAHAGCTSSTRSSLPSSPLPPRWILRRRWCRIPRSDRTTGWPRPTF